MELGISFDDDDFTEKVRHTETLSSYNAKVCYPEWFFSGHADNGRNDMATVYKFRGDYFFQKDDLKSAIHCYQNSLDRLGENNRTMRREIMESLSRSHIKNREFQTSQKYVENVLSDCLTPENYCQALLLQQHMYKYSGDIPKELGILQQLITILPVNAQIWLKIVHVYEKIKVLLKQKERNGENDEIKNIRYEPRDYQLLEITEIVKEKCAVHTEKYKKLEESTNWDSFIKCNKLSSCGARSRHEFPNECLKKSEEDFNQTGVSNLNEANQNLIPHIDTRCLKSSMVKDYPINMILLTCYIRTRLLLCCVQGTVGSFIKDKNVQLVDEIDCKIGDLKVSDTLHERVSQFVRHDLFEEDADNVDDKTDQNKDIKIMVETVITPEEFNERWFSWIKELS